MLDRAAAARVLGIDDGGDPARAARSLMMCVHPDQHPGPGPQHLFKLIVEARDVLLAPAPPPTSPPDDVDIVGDTLKAQVVDGAKVVARDVVDGVTHAARDAFRSWLGAPRGRR
jgi:hypothetical protein